ncbi:hypothetical protein KAT51_05400 [bacterium]|nr:hypothetical protein [bacterium]
MLEVPEDFVYEIEATPYGMSLSVTIEKLPIVTSGYLEVTEYIDPPWIDETLF